MRRTIDVIGRDIVLQRDVVTDFASLPLDRSSTQSLIASSARVIADRMPADCPPLDVVLFDVDPELPQFDTATRYTGDDTGDDTAAGARLDVRPDVTDDPMRTLMEIAYGYSQHYWQSRSTPESLAVRPLDIHPRTTTLLPITLGLGVLASTVSLAESHWSAVGFSGWSMARCGYYSAIEIGYALALLARVRGQADPAWLSSLRLDSRSTAIKATKMFQRHQNDGGTLLFDATRIPGSDRDPTELATWLAGDDPCFAMAAAYALAKWDALPTVAVDAALQRTHDRDKEMQVLATRLLGSAPTSDRRVTERVSKLCQSKVGAVSLAALHAASRLGIPMTGFLRRVAGLLTDPTTDLIPICGLIDRHPRDFASLSPIVCDQMAAAIGYQDEEAAAALAQTLVAISDDPIAEVELRVRMADTRKEVIRRIRDVRPHA